MKKANGAFVASDLITFANNGIMFLFDNIKYLLSSTEIESVYNPGHVSNIISLAKNNNDFQGLLQCWSLDSDNTPADSNKGFKKRRKFTHSSVPLGSFRFAVPLNHILGFADDYHKVLYGFTHSLVLTRASSDANALFKKKGYSNRCG